MAKRRRKAAGLLPAAVEEINRLRAEWAALKDSDLLVEKTSSSSKKPQNHNNKKLSSSAKLSNEVLRGVVALVEVGSERRALPLRAALSALGASVVPLWNPFVTHVIWGKGGDRKTRAAARSSAARVVSPLWVEACSASNRHLSEKAYPAAPRPSDIPSPLALLKLLKKAEAKMGTSSPDQAKNILSDQSVVLISLLDSDSDEVPQTETKEKTSNDTSKTASHSSSLDRTSEPSNASNGNSGIKEEMSSGSKRHSVVTCLADSSTTTDEEVGVNKRARRALPRSLSTSEANVVIRPHHKKRSSSLDSPLTLEDDEESDKKETEQREAPSRPPAPPTPTETESADLDSPITIEDDDESDESGSNADRSTQCEKKDEARTDRSDAPVTVARAPDVRAPDAPGPSPGTSSTASSSAKPGPSGLVTSRSVAVGTDPEPLFSGHFGALKRRAMDEPGYSGSFLGRFAPMTGRFVPVPAYSSAIAPGRYVPILSTETESQAAIQESRFPRNVWPRSRAQAVIPPGRPRSPDDDDERIVQAPAPSQDTVYSTDGKIRIVLTGMSRVERKRALMAMGKLSGAQCQRSVNYKTTHIVVGLFGRDLGGDDSGTSAPRSRLLSSPLRSRYPASALRLDDERTPRTFSAIAGAARGCRVVSSSWLYDSEVARRWLSCRPYAVPEFRDTAEKAFLERQAYGMLDKEYAYNVFYGRRVRLSQFVENRRACEELLILCGAVVLDENGAICHNGDLDLDDIEPEVEDGGPLPRPIQHRRIGPFLDARFGRPPPNGTNQNRSHSPPPALLPNRVPPRNLVIRASPNAQRLLWRGHDRIRFSEVMIGALYGQVSSRWVFDSVTHGRMHSIRHYIPLGTSRHLVVEAEVEVVDTNEISRF